MSLDTPSITWRHLQGKVHAWTMFFGTKQSWSSSYMMFMLQMKKVMTLKPGLFTVKLGNLTSKRSNHYIGIFLNKKKNFFIQKRLSKLSKIEFYNILQEVNTKSMLSKWTNWTNLISLRVRVVTFLRNTVTNTTL